MPLQERSTSALFLNMPEFFSLDQIELHAAWLTIGIFDGVHLGHRKLLTQLVDGAHAVHSPAVVLTFSPHPAVVLGGDKDFRSLSTASERLELLYSAGVDAVIQQTFNSAFAAQSAADFMHHASRRLGLQHLVIGHDTALGRGRQGDANRLSELGAELGYSVEVVPPLLLDGELISSSRIRQFLQEGTLPQANSMLGRWYSLSGTVVHGDGRGRHINVPTANIAYPQDKLVPARGIYATWAWVDGQRFPAATNIGTNPTFTPEKQVATLEAHLLDFHADLYGKQLRLEFVSCLRDEMKFSSVESLLAQIHADIILTRQVLQDTFASA